MKHLALILTLFLLPALEATPARAASAISAAPEHTLTLTAKTENIRKAPVKKRKGLFRNLRSLKLAHWAFMLVATPLLAAIILGVLFGSGFLAIALLYYTVLYLFDLRNRNNWWFQQR